MEVSRLTTDERKLDRLPKPYHLLRRCPRCGEFRGRVPHPEGIWPGADVICLCDGIACRYCGSRIHRPISDYFNEERGCVIHVPWFGANLPCRDCEPKRKQAQPWLLRGRLARIALRARRRITSLAAPPA